MTKTSIFFLVFCYLQLVVCYVNNIKFNFKSNKYYIKIKKKLLFKILRIFNIIIIEILKYNIIDVIFKLISHSKENIEFNYNKSLVKKIL
jgi:hypothetical protein